MAQSITSTAGAWVTAILFLAACGGNTSGDNGAGDGGAGGSGSGGGTSSGAGSGSGSGGGSGSSGGAGSCGNVAPCGGNIVGAWTITNACANGSVTAAAGGSCPNEMEQIASLSASGTISFLADGTFSMATTTSISLGLTIPSTCLSQGGFTISCDAIPTALGGADAGVTTTCMTSGANCDCTLSQGATDSTGTGTYTTSSTTVTITPSDDAGGAPTTDSYCVQGNTLYLLQTSTSSDAGTTGIVTVTIVAVKAQ